MPGRRISRIGHDVLAVGQAPTGGPTPPRPAADAPHPVFVRAFEYPRGYIGYTHRHRLAQVVYPLRGVVSVETYSGTWVVTTLTAVAIPPWREHRVSAHGNASLRSVFVDPDAHPTLCTEMTTLHVSELLHELIREAGRHYTDFDSDDELAAGVIALIVRLLPTLPTSDTSVWLPRVETDLMRPVAIALDDDPGDSTSVDEWARRLGLSARHFSRLFKDETGVPFSTWRALHHVKHALLMLASGASVTRVAMDLGYGSTSSFIEMFKRHTGRTPGAWLETTASRVTAAHSRPASA
jgi:AraC-like DNA-binding protein/quercetin dioxygenase-like cupin family protein